MATLRLVVQKKRKDGYWPVYIRVVHRGKPSFMPTGKVVNDKGLTKSREIKDTFVLSLLMPRIVEYTEALNRVDVTNWTVQEVVNFLKTGTEDISFSEYARRHADRMVDEGHVRNARNYVLALQHLERFLGTTDVKFSALTSATIEKWIRSLSTTSRAKEMYPVCLRQVFRAALLDYNDYDKGVMRIKTNPWMRIRIPRADRPEKLAITPEEARAFFAAPLPQTKVVAPLSEVGRDTAMFVLCLAGINTVDLYNMRKVDYHEGILHYKRSKTRGSRSDEAYIEMRVPPILQPLMEKYATGDDDDRLFSFHNRFSTSDSFGSGANTGIKQICESMGITGDSRYCVYTFRHTWGTVAQNDCGATIA
ncbi:site-specific integrase, partial [uncultured Muribaculum sp.]